MTRRTVPRSRIDTSGVVILGRSRVRVGRTRSRLRSAEIDRRDIAAIAAEVAAAVDLAEGPSGVLDIVRAVARHEPAPVRVVSRHAELPVPLVAAVCNELRRRDVVDTARPVRLTESARAALADDRWQDAGRCGTCDGRGIDSATTT